MKKIILKDDAEKELQEAFFWYMRKDRNIALDFFNEVVNAVEKIANSPKAWPAMGRRHRKFLLEKFPYNIFYREENDFIIIDAIAHQKRKPGYWRFRK